MLTKNDIPKYTCRYGWTETVTHQSYNVRVKIEFDELIRQPWKENDGHGPVSEWRKRETKTPGERILHSDGNSCLFYDFGAAVRIAKKDGWDAPPYKTGTKGEQAVRAVEADYKYLRGFCNDDWYYVVVTVEVTRKGEQVSLDNCGGVESLNDYWREHAAESANCAIRADQKRRRQDNRNTRKFFHVNLIGAEL